MLINFSGIKVGPAYSILVTGFNSDVDHTSQNIEPALLLLSSLARQLACRVTVQCTADVRSHVQHFVLKRLISNVYLSVGLSGKVHNELLKGLCNGLPPVIAERLLEKLSEYLIIH